MSRAKGNRLERSAIAAIIEADGPDPHATAIASSTGRVGHLDVGADGYSRRFAIECKNRESIGAYLWEWLSHLDKRVAWREHIPILIVKRNRRQPLVVLDLDYFLALIKERGE